MAISLGCPSQLPDNLRHKGKYQSKGDGLNYRKDSFARIVEILRAHTNGSEGSSHTD
jgi:hypothetical protein